MLGTQLLGVRLATVLVMTPLFVLVYLVGAADGLWQRAIRAASGARESAGLYHRAKSLQIAVAGAGMLGALLWPGEIDWMAFSLPLAVSIGIMARVQWAFYKKHV